MSQYSQADKMNHLELKQVLGKTYQYIPKKGSVLDVGCSAGYFGESLIKDNHNTVDGIEIDPGDVKKAKNVLNNVFSFDLENDAYPEELMKKKYDVIFFGDVLEHLKDPGDILKKFSKLLKSKGKIIISIPNIAHASIRLELLSGNFEYEKLGILDETHLKYFTFTSFSRLLNKSGFRIIDYDYALSILPREVIDDWLKEIGLRGSIKFYDLMNSPEAASYQYKFVVELGNTKQTPQVPTKPLELAVKHSTQMGELNKMIDSLHREIRNRDKNIEDLKNSASWKITSPLRKIKGMKKK